MNKLREIINRDRLFTMIYSGVENEKYFNILYNMGIRNFLISFHYITEKNIDIKKQYKDKNIKFFIDSGAHTYQNDPKYLDYPIEYWENHLKKYLDWAKENKDYIFAIANFDFENLVGAEKIQEWNKKYFEPFMLETGIPVCFVWHQDSYTTWERYCERYPYVGFSSVNTEGEAIELKEYISKLKIAQKYNSVVHGFGMTRTSMLPKLPFYTVDSTTWLVGLQYGEINYWNGTKMSRLKKEKWKGEYLPKLIALGLNKEKLLAEDTEEMIKANIIPFIEAEKYIRQRLRSRMYWLKQEKNNNSLDDTDLFPPLDWLEGKTEPQYDNWEEYAKRLNINVEDRTFAINAVIDCSVFCQIDIDEEGEITSENPDLLNFFNESYLGKNLIPELHDLYINQVSSDEKEQIRDLINFFRDVATGKEEKLLNWGTAFAKAREREKYIEEEEYEYEDLTEEEIRDKLSELLPAPKDDSDPHPEVTALDDEIFNKAGIVPVRDSKGRFLKGQRKVRKPKNIYSDKYPKLACDTCYAAQSCPEYKAGYVCAYNKMFKRFDTRDMNDIIDAMQSMVNLNLERMQRVALFEILDGGMPDGNLTAMIDQNMRLLKLLKDMYQYGNPEVLKQTKIKRADGTEETIVQVSNPRGGGILEKLFSQTVNKSNNNNKEEETNPKSKIDKENAIDVDIE
ncbi:MAG: hypothetical protein H0Z24_05645 [Thermosipho sp. (in: Bacteria)]|nr:hypothetical protein [Thermosipho sp. (in: thermotogales)]